MTDYLVKDINLSDISRNELDIAKIQMPVLTAFRFAYGQSKPLKGTSIAGLLNKKLVLTICW